MGQLFRNHAYSSVIQKHIELPLYKTYEFTFYRCVNVEEWVYKTTISKLHSNNFRLNESDGRNSKLFPNEKISYWADSKSTALAEIKKHGGNKNYLTFEAYDDSSSTFPSLDVDDDLVIIDGRDFEFHRILLKIEKGDKLTDGEEKIIEAIKNQNPDCLAYNSVAKEGGLNFLFFENGFNKLALREVKLYLGEMKSKNANTVPCAITCDYTPIIESYGMYFELITKIKVDCEYIHTEEYKIRSDNFKKSLHLYRRSMNNSN